MVAELLTGMRWMFGGRGQQIDQEKDADWNRQTGRRIRGRAKGRVVDVSPGGH